MITKDKLKRVVSPNEAGKKYKLAFSDAYKLMSPAEKKLYRSYVVEVANESDLKEKLKKLKQDPEVEFAEPNYLATVNYVPTDPQYISQWAHQVTQAEQGWDIELGNNNTIIAINTYYSLH